MILTLQTILSTFKFLLSPFSRTTPAFLASYIYNLPSQQAAKRFDSLYMPGNSLLGKLKYGVFEQNQFYFNLTVVKQSSNVFHGNKNQGIKGKIQITPICIKFLSLIELRSISVRFRCSIHINIVFVSYQQCTKV